MTGEGEVSEVDALRRHISGLQSGMWINCVYCGHRYGPAENAAVSIPGVSEEMAEVLRKHIETCPKHPLSQLRAEYAETVSRLRARLEALREERDLLRRDLENERRPSVS